VSGERRIADGPVQRIVVQRIVFPGGLAPRPAVEHGMPTLPALALALLLASCAPSGLRSEMASAAIPARGRVGAAALLVETGERVSLEGGGRFPMQSVYKAPIAMAVLRRVDAGRLRLDQKVRVEKSDLVPSMARSAIRDRYPEGGIELPLSELLRASVSDSDGTASDVLLRLTGAAEVTRMLRDMAISGMVVATSETAMSAGERVQYLKVRVVLEVKEEKQVEAIKPTMPRVTDIFQTYMRELRPVDLNGSAGLFRLKEELNRRVNAVVAPSEVNAVLFKEIVVQ